MKGYIKDRTRIKQPKLNLVTVGRDSSFPSDATVADQCKNLLICSAILAGQAHIKFLSRIGTGSRFGFGFGISNLEMYCNALRHGSFRSLRTLRHRYTLSYNFIVCCTVHLKAYAKRSHPCQDLVRGCLWLNARRQILFVGKMWLVCVLRAFVLFLCITQVQYIRMHSLNHYKPIEYHIQ